MAQPRSTSRGPSSSRPNSTHSTRSEGAYLPPSTLPSEADYDFCNSFWVTPQRSRRDGRDEDSEEKDWGKEGYETVMGRVKSAGKVLEDLKGVFKERAALEEDYSKRLGKLSKSSFGNGETGHMERAMITLKQELETSSKSHHDLASLLKQQEAMVNDFIAKRDGARKTQQSAIEKTWKNMNNQREHVLKAKTKYENDAIQINSLHAQASLLQGRELDKATLKMDKVQQTVVVNERDYKNFVGVLKETTVNWNMAWKTFCDLVQDQEEERLEFIKGRMWDWANAQSTIAMAEDESAERTRTALEQCEPRLDIRIFVQRSATGNCIPDPLPFVDAARTTPHPKQGYKIAKFSRSSTRIPGVKHSPSAVNDIARALHQQPTSATSSIPPSASNPTNSARSPAADGGGGGHHRGSSSTSLGGGGGISRPASRSAQHPSNSNLLVESISSQSIPPSASQETTPTRPPPSNDLSSSSRFAPSPNALRQSHGTGENRSVSPTPGSTRPGHINASAFQNRPPVASTQPPAQYSTSPSTSPRKPHAFSSSAAPASAPTATDDDNDDPLLQALKVLQSTPAPVASPRSSRMSPNPTSVSSHSPAPARPLSSMGSRPANHRPQSSLGQNIPQPSRSRPTSPAPVAAMMQPNSNSQPPPSQSHSQSMSVPYGQAFPGERAGQSISRPGSRAGSNVSQNQYQPNRNSLASPSSVPNFQQQQRPTSPGGEGGGGFAGVGARGRSPSPQPFIPESLRPRSPAVAQQMQAQAQQQQTRPTSAYGHRPPVQQQPVQQSTPTNYGTRPVSNYGGPPPPQGYPQAQPPQTHPYAAAAPQPSPYARTASPAPPGNGGYVPSQHPYSSVPPPPPSTTTPSNSQHFSQQPHAYSANPPPSLAHSQSQAQTNPSYPYPSQTPSHSHHSPYTPVPAPSSNIVPQQQYVSSASPSVQRTPSIHSGVGTASVVSQSPYQQQSQQSHVRATSVASVRAGSVPPPPPTGQYTEQGQPIIFYVNALFDYRAASNEEFSFSQGDVIAVTATDPDGWWQGLRVGDQGPSKLFPSNFTELLS
ncbi:uncharacterized protein JCM6883_001168 [Sporobolomyces salmoneus]|uniref:uncharacterized protein n=1 Tax=Sporobolomyces salmoneus TaxID=183962 RepID=UPI00316EC4CC